jgi:hypothetical protein
VCLQVATDRAVSKHLGHSRNLGKAGLPPIPSDGRTVDDTAMLEFGDLWGCGRTGRPALLCCPRVHLVLSADGPDQ